MRPRIVYVAPQPPYPLTSGMPIRQFHLLRAYASWGRVKLVFFYRDDAQLEAARPLAEYCESLHPVSVDTCYEATTLHRYSRLHRRARLTLARRPSAVTVASSPQMARVVGELAGSADLVHVARLHMVAAVEGLLGRRRHRARFVLDLDDVETSLHAKRLRFIPLRLWPHIGLGGYEWLKLWAYQARALRRFDRILVCSDRDRLRLRSTKVITVPNGTAVPVEPPESDTDGRTILFCGLLSYPPNIDAIEFFVSRILPEIRNAVPDVRFVIVGRTPPDRVRALHDGRIVSVHADVTSVVEHYQKATLAVVPMRFAGGTRLKILEAWALGVPVVSTGLGCEGLQAINGEHLLVADQPGRFAHACVELLRRPATRKRLAERGRELVWRKYRWDAIGSEMVTMAGELMAGQGSESGTARRRTAVGT